MRYRVVPILLTDLPWPSTGRNGLQKAQNAPELPPKRPKMAKMAGCKQFKWSYWQMGGHAYISTYTLRPKPENGKIPKLECHLVAKPNGGFWVDSIFLHHITSTLCVHSHIKISVFKVVHFTGNV